MRRLVRFRQLVLFKLFQEIRNSARQRSRLIFLVCDREFLTDKVTKQAVVSSPFFQRSKPFCLHAIRFCVCAAISLCSEHATPAIVPIVSGARQSPYGKTECQKNKKKFRGLQRRYQRTFLKSSSVEKYSKRVRNLDTEFSNLRVTW